MHGPIPPRRELDARLVTLLCKSNIVVKPNEATSRRSNSNKLTYLDGYGSNVVGLLLVMVMHTPVRSSMHPSNHLALLMCHPQWIQEDRDTCDNTALRSTHEAAVMWARCCYCSWNITYSYISYIWITSYGTLIWSSKIILGSIRNSSGTDEQRTSCAQLQMVRVTV